MKKTLIAFAAFALVAFAGVAGADTLQCDTPLGQAVASAMASPDFAPEGTVENSEDHGDLEIQLEGSEDTETLEQILLNKPFDPQLKAIDSGICCSSKSDCPNVSGYSKRCDSASCYKSCLYW